MTRRKPEPPDPDVLEVRRAAQWLADGDTGVSSETMVLIALGATKDPKGRWGVPRDSGDFGRCHRMLERLPFVRHHFGKVLELVPAYGPLFREWETLTRLFEAGMLASEQVAVLARHGEQMARGAAEKDGAK